MKIVLYSRPQMDHQPEELRVLMEALRKASFSFAMNSDFADMVEQRTGISIPPEERYDRFERGCEGADVAVSYGGDGTFIHIVKMLEQRTIPVLGINSGRLGFLANVPKDGITLAFDDLQSGRYSLRDSSLLVVEGDFSTPPEHPYAFNEVAIQRGESSMIVVETYVDNEMVAKYRGDGVLVSTPAGSTAYSLSVGGPVVAPECGCFVISPIAPHNLTMRPVIVPDSSEVMFRVCSRDGRVQVNVDSVRCEAESGAEFRVRKARRSASLVVLDNRSFYETLRNKMLWGVDRRDGRDE